MPSVEISEGAEADPTSIYEHSFLTYGQPQADRYRDELTSAITMLAEAPGLGRRATPKRPSMPRFRRRDHVIFYEQTRTGILIVRVLHAKMDMMKRVLGEDEAD